MSFRYWGSDVFSSDLLGGTRGDECAPAILQPLESGTGHARRGQYLRRIEPTRMGNGHDHRAARRGSVASDGGGRKGTALHWPWGAKNCARIQAPRQFVKSLGLQGAYKKIRSEEGCDGKEGVR